MSARKDKTHRLMGVAGKSALLLATALLCGTSQAQESSWKRLARIVSPNATTEKSQQTIESAKTSTAETAGVAGDVPAAAVPQAPDQQVALGSDGAVPLSAESDESLSDFADGKKSRLGLESDDAGANLATDLFKDPEILRLMGDKLRFRYNSNGRQDPMLVPWVRNEAIYSELSHQADDLSKNGQLDQAAEVYKRILDLKDSRYQAPTLAKLNALMNLKSEQARALLAEQNVAIVEAPVELPAWINDNTTAVMVSRGQQMCMVGDNMLAIGDSVPNYPDVKVASINDDKVSYQIKNKTFEVTLVNR